MSDGSFESDHYALTQTRQRLRCSQLRYQQGYTRRGSKACAILLLAVFKGWALCSARQSAKCLGQFHLGEVYRLMELLRVDWLIGSMHGLGHPI
jgi:hypothetical protein